MKYSTFPFAIAAGICVSQVSPPVCVSGRSTNVLVPCGRADTTATSTGDSLRMLARTVKSLASGGWLEGLVCSTAGGCGWLALADLREGAASWCFLGAGSALATAFGAAAPPTATAFED